MSDGSAQGTESAAETAAGGRGFGGYLQLCWSLRWSSQACTSDKRQNGRP